MARKGAFKDDDLGDIDDLLPPPPPPPPVSTAPARVTPDAEAPAVMNGADDEVASGPAKVARKAPAAKAVASESAVKRARTVPARTRAVPPMAEAHVASVVAEALRTVTHREKQARGKGRSYGEVVLDAIEEFETELREHFQGLATAEPSGRLFKRVDRSRPRRRRHTEPPVKIPLAGIIADDIKQLDELVAEWKAGSRSALVDEALKLYLAEEISDISEPGEDSVDQD
ncbi:hypothetical protein ACFROC_00350 [Nocardia tengchongensis]|uniref:hypothetical protein n=1 Tax=Nocardia tengchongensis TaxID=2055889 RepID=UPI0036C68EA1